MPDEEPRSLPTEEEYAVAGKLTEAFAHHDLRSICAILMEAVRRVGINEVARRTGIQRTAIHAALVTHCNPQLLTLLAITRAVGLRFYAYPVNAPVPAGPVDVSALRGSR